MSTNKYVYLKSFTGIENLVLAEGPIPKPGRAQVLIRVHAVSLNYRDLLIASGKYGAPGIQNVVPTSDGAGEIIEVGEDVNNFKKGDRVYGTFFQGFQGGQLNDPKLFASALGAGSHGMLTQYKVLDESGVVKFPEHLSYEEAATLPCAAVTAYNSLYEAQHPLKAGDTVLILGTGGVSIFGLQLAKAAGARVIVTSSSDEKLAFAKKLGADELINYNKVPEWHTRVLELTNGRGVDHVLEVGGGNTLKKSLQSTRIMGHVGIIGFVSGGVEQGLVFDIISRAINVRGILIGSVETCLNLNRVIEFQKLKPVVDKVFPIEETQQAYKYLESQKHVGKVVIKL